MNDFRLRDFIDSDLTNLNSIRNDRAALRSMNSRFTNEEDLKGTKNWIERQLSSCSIFVIVEYQGQCAGFIKSKLFSFGDRGFVYEEIGIALHREFRRKGIASRAVLEFINSGKVDRYIARVISSNQGSLNLFSRTGFKEIGRVMGVISTCAETGNDDENSMDIIFMEYRR